MALFAYKARSHRGESVRGVIEAASSDIVASQLINGGMTPVNIDLAVKKTHESISLEKMFPQKVKPSELIQFSRQMHSLLRAGVPILSALMGISNSTKNLVFKTTIEEVIQHLESGRDLATCLSLHPKIFSLFYISMIRIGETSGKLDAIFIQLARYLERDSKTRMQIKSALRYPSFVFLAIVIAIGIINVFVIPTFAKIFFQYDTELPWMTKVLLAVSGFTVKYWLEMIVASIVTFFGLRHYLNTDKGRYAWDKKKLTLPIVGGLIHKAILARFARLFAMSSSAGVPLITALTVVAKALENSYMEDKVTSMQEGIERGDSVSRTATAAGMFDSLVLQMISIGEESGTIDDLLREVADYYDTEVDYEIESLSASIEPILTIFIAGIVLVLALGVFLPMWDMSKAMMH